MKPVTTNVITSLLVLSVLFAAGYFWAEIEKNQQSNKAAQTLKVEIVKIQEQRPGSVIRRKFLGELEEAGVVKRKRVQATAEQKAAKSEFKVIKARPVVKTRKYAKKGQFLEEERTTFFGPVQDVYTCVVNCAKYLLPLDSIELVRDANGNINFPAK
jgi:hypothetical protein